MVPSADTPATPFAEAGDVLTDEVLDTYISGFTADEYYTVIEDTVSEAFTAETRYSVTDVPESVPTIVVHYPDPSFEEPIVAGDGEKWRHDRRGL